MNYKYNLFEEDVVTISTDPDFEFDMEHNLFALSLFLQQVHPITANQSNPIQQIKTLFFMYFNDYIFVDTLDI